MRRKMQRFRFPLPPCHPSGRSYELKHSFTHMQRTTFRAVFFMAGGRVCTATSPSQGYPKESMGNRSALHRQLESNAGTSCDSRQDEGMNR